MRTMPFIMLSSVTLLAACGDSGVPAASRDGSGPVVPPADPSSLVLKAETSLPPGQSGFFSLSGQALGSATGNPGDYGAHVDDQRLAYWSFQAKPGVLGSKPGTATVPLAGVELYRDRFGVPIVYAPNVHDLWFGVGYAIAQDRLFLMDAVRRMGAGTMGELTGCGAVPGDIQQRTLAYSDAEYTAFFNALSADAQSAVQGYVDGANAWRTQAITVPTNLPAEYGLLTTTPAAFTVKDVLAAGVFITRFVAAEGGNEFQNVHLLRGLQQQYGSRTEALKAFQDLVWLEDPNAVTTITRAAGTFSNQPAPPGGRDAVLATMADWALSLPDTLARGPGTGNAGLPQPCAALSSLPLAAPAAPPLAIAPRASSPSNRLEALRRIGGQVAATLEAFRRQLHGGSHAYALAPSRTRDHGTLLLSGPQLGYSYPTLLVEYEIHLTGNAGYAARGSSVPLLPVVGIGYTDHVAWGLTTGYSKTVDSFVETLCSTAQITAGTCKADQYFHQKQWKDLDCRNESFSYRASASGVPIGTASLSTTQKICRSVHGPIVARDDAAGVARSVQYAMFRHELDTLAGITAWNRAKSFADFVDGVKQVSWNENVTVASRDGHIGYFHPGLFPARSADTDMRLPSPGTGEYDFGANLPFAQLPQVVDPAEGYLANWNTKPAYGWLDGEGLGATSRPGGPGQRVTTILDTLATRNDWSYSDLPTIDAIVGTRDHRARNYVPALQAFRSSAAARLSDVQQAALDRVLAWDRSAYGPNIDLGDASAKDGPAATIFGELVLALRDELFAPLKTMVIDDLGTTDTGDDLNAYAREAGTGSHVFDMSAMDNLILRILDPASSGLVVQRDYSGGRDRDSVMLAALNTALSRMATEYNNGTALAVADLDKCLRVHPRSQLCSLSGVIGPGSSTVPGTSCVTMPYQDRGSWVHRVGYEKP